MWLGADISCGYSPYGRSELEQRILLRWDSPSHRHEASTTLVTLGPRLLCCSLSGIFLEIATITYRSGPEWEQRFGRKVRSPPTEGGTAIGEELPRTPLLCPDFLIETYLDHQVCFPSESTGHSLWPSYFWIRENNSV
jgi:hypothetical protein